MAFVFQQKRKLDNPPPQQSMVGPGKYDLQSSSKDRQEYAPFSSTTKKVPIATDNKVPGVGNYQIDRRIIQPSLKAYTNRHNVIIKIHSTGTIPFQSKIDRFGVRDQVLPGPGQYLNISKTVDVRSHQSPTKPHKVSKNQSKPRNKTNPSIHSKTIYLNRKSKQKKQKPIQFTNPTKGQLSSVWGKDKVKRFQSISHSLDYSYPIKPDLLHEKSKLAKSNKKQPSSTFISNSVRSFFDKIYYNTNSKDKAEMRSIKKYKSQHLGPAYYNPIQEETEDPYYHKNRSFGSGKERFKTEISQSKIPFYDNYRDLSKQVSHLKREIPFISEAPRITNPKQIIPGPGHYEGQNINKRRFEIAIQNFGSKQKRFFDIPDQHSKIGPGYYPTEVKKVRTENDECQSYTFKSNIPAFYERREPPDNKFGSYKINATDISQQSNERKKFLDNLKKINVYKPGFEQNQPRFEHYEPFYQLKTLQKNKPSKREKLLNILSYQQQARQSQIEKIKGQVGYDKPVQLGSGSPRFKNPKKAPGVGDYNMRNKWNKKSFNIKYNNDNTFE